MRDLQQMFAGWPGVLGPLGALGAAEREDVAKALTIVGFKPMLVICVGKEATQAVKARINQTVRGPGAKTGARVNGSTAAWGARTLGSNTAVHVASYV